MKYSATTWRIIKSAMNVHSELHSGFQEKNYQRAMAIEFDFQKIQYAREVSKIVLYRNKWVGDKSVDFVVENVVSVELKAKSNLEREDFAKAFKYLEILNLEVGLLINFGAESLQYHRLTNKKFKEIKVDDKSISSDRSEKSDLSSSSEQSKDFRSYLDLYDDDDIIS